MGMFDTVISGFRLDPYLAGENTHAWHRDFMRYPLVMQTKDLECGLDVYRIDKKGRLFQELRGVRRRILMSGQIECFWVAKTLMLAPSAIIKFRFQGDLIGLSCEFRD